MDLLDIQCDVKLLSPLTLAFVGDAVYELLVRQELVSRGSMPVGKLHKLAVERVKASAQSLAFDKLCELATEKELAILKRGRNASGVRPPRNADTVSYRKATGVEALFGYLYLEHQNERILEIFKIVQECIDSEAKKIEKEF